MTLAEQDSVKNLGLMFFITLNFVFIGLSRDFDMLF